MKVNLIWSSQLQNSGLYGELHVTIPSSYVTTSHLTSLLALLQDVRSVVTYSLTKGMLAFPATGLKQSVKRSVRGTRSLRD